MDVRDLNVFVIVSIDQMDAYLPPPAALAAFSAAFNSMAFLSASCNGKGIVWGCGFR